jgi:penicillin-binding protein 1A
MSNQAAMTLLDVLRGVIDSGTAVGLRPRFQLAGDLAGKTGTTQDNTDGWFMLMHPNLVAGAWMGFNDNRVAMRSSYWGQGAHNALLVVGDFMQQAQKAGLVDPKAQFAAPRMKDVEQQMLQGVKDWWNSVFSTPPAEEPQTAALPPVNLDPPVLQPPPASLDLPPSSQIVVSPPVLPNSPVIVDASPQRVPSFPRPLETGRTPEPARPADTITGTQVYRAPSETPLRSSDAPSTAATGAGPATSGAVLSPRPLQAPETRVSPETRVIMSSPPSGGSSSGGSVSSSGSGSTSSSSAPTTSMGAGTSSSSAATPPVTSSAPAAEATGSPSAPSPE